MRQKILSYLKMHPTILSFIWSIGRFGMVVWGLFLPRHDKQILFASFGGRKFDDSPRAIYDEICSREEFRDYTLIWAFVEPEKFHIPRGEKIRIDTFSFFKTLLQSRVWVSNSGMDRGLDLKRKANLRIETWHGTPLKKIGGEENSNSMVKKKPDTAGRRLDADTIRCAQSEFDRDIFSRIFSATKESFLLCDLPRNDALLRYDDDACRSIKEKLDIPQGKIVILYTPTYREYLVDSHLDNYIVPPMDLEKWQNALGDEYVFLFRAHYAVTAALGLAENDFVKDVSAYPTLNDLYAVSDLMISDYSSTFFDYSILGRPMLCFAYDQQEYEEKRGLYLDLAKVLPCPVDHDEDTVIARIKTLDWPGYAQRTKEFSARFAPHAGHASAAVVDKLEEYIKTRG